MRVLAALRSLCERVLRVRCVGCPAERSCAGAYMAGWRLAPDWETGEVAGWSCPTCVLAAHPRWR